MKESDDILKGDVLSTQSPVSHIDYHGIWSFLPIAWLIRANNEYVIFLDKDGDLDWQTTASLDERVEKACGLECNIIFNLGAELNAQPVEYLSSIQRKNFRIMVGEGFASLFRLDSKSAMQMLKTAQDYLNARNQEIARGWQLQATAISAGIFSIIFISIWLARLDVANVLGYTGMHLVLGSCSGGVGALFSILVRIGAIPLDPSAGPTLHRMEGVARVLAGATGAGIAQLAIHLSLILGILKDSGLTAMVFIGLVAGASERLVPAIIKRVENDAVSNATSKAQQTI